LVNRARPRIALLAHRVASPSATGIGRYYVEIATSLARADGQHDYVLANTREREKPRWLPDGLEHKVVPGPRKAVAVAWALSGRPRADRWLGAPDLVHALHPWTATPTRAPLVVTIHDLMPIQHPGWYPRHETWLFKRGVDYVRDHAATVIAVSGHVADQLQAEAGIERDRLRVVHEAAGDEFRIVPSPALVAEVCARHGVMPGRFLMAIGQIARRKNLGVVLRALARLNPDLLGTPALLAAGPRGVGAEEVDADIERLGLASRVRFAGYVPGEDLPVLLASSAALVHPSLGEGFGFTPLEAMAAGVPAIAARSGALPEVMGDAGVLVNPTDPDAWAQAIERVLRDREHRVAVIGAQTVHQEHYRWSRVAAETAAVHADVLEDGR
jgi:alpha-1,3-rhamnosyl/mannosyltransferase